MSETEKPAESPKPPKPPKPAPTIREQAARVVNRKITGAISQAKSLLEGLDDADCEQLVVAQAFPVDQFAALLHTIRETRGLIPKPDPSPSPTLPLS